jgi:hypothetical protein
MTNYLFNPFKFIAGGKSLIAGLLVLLSTAFIGFIGNTHFPDLISLKMSPGFPFVYLLLQNLSNWIVFSTLLYIAALIASPSSVRAIDIFGTQALARFPYFIAAFTGFSGSLERFGQAMVEKALHGNSGIDLSPFDIIMAIILTLVIVLMMVWMVALMYKAFTVSANMKGTKAVVIFIVVFIVSVAITMLISVQGNNHLSNYDQL